MKYKELENQIKELRTLYKELETDEEKDKLVKEAQEKGMLLKCSFGCYQCDEVLSREQLPECFCNDECKEEYWGKNDAIHKKLTKSWSVEEMVEGLKKMAHDEHEKGNYR